MNRNKRNRRNRRLILNLLHHWSDGGGGGGLGIEKVTATYVHKMAESQGLGLVPATGRRGSMLSILLSVIYVEL